MDYKAMWEELKSENVVASINYVDKIPYELWT